MCLLHQHFLLTSSQPLLICLLVLHAHLVLTLMFVHFMSVLNGHHHLLSASSVLVLLSYFHLHLKLLSFFLYSLKKKKIIKAVAPPVSHFEHAVCLFFTVPLKHLVVC